MNPATLAFAICAFVLFAPLRASMADQPVQLDVVLKITDLDYKPLAGVAGRLTFGSDPHWQTATSGTRFVTEADGSAHVTADAALDTRWRKYPTNII